MRDQEGQLVLYGQKFSSRLLLGTARYESPSLLTEAIGAADPAMITVSLRRQLSASKDSGQPSGICFVRHSGRFSPTQQVVSRPVKQ